MEHQIPEGNQPLTSMLEPNAPSLIYEGQFRLTTKDFSFDCLGKFEFCWTPSPQIIFSASCINNQEIFTNFTNHVRFEILINGKFVGKCFLTNITQSNIKNITVRGKVVGKIVIGNDKTTVDNIRFEIPNLRSTFGESIKIGNTLARARITLEDNNYIIHIDKLVDFNNRYNSLLEQGGFILTHTGSITQKGKKISIKRADKILSNLNLFLSFINGLRTAPVYIKGVKNDKIVWELFEIPDVDPFKTVWSWIPTLKSISLTPIWQNFTLLDLEDNDWLKNTILWYVEVNRKVIYAEGSLVLAQCALELLYNRVIVEDKKILKGEDAKKISAAAKIRLLLSSLGLPANVPKELINITNYNNKGDGPEIIVDLRNAIVHAQETKRKILKTVPGPVRVETLDLAIQYIELILLKLLDYKGPIFNRCKEVSYS